MSPETLVDQSENSGVEYYLKSEKVINMNTVAANGSTYRKDRDGVIPRIIEDYYDSKWLLKFL